MENIGIRSSEYLDFLSFLAIEGKTGNKTFEGRTKLIAFLLSLFRLHSFFSLMLYKVIHIMSGWSF